jgi:putative zinc finger protein
MTCDEAVALIDDYADGLFTPEQRADLEAHLDNCPNCRAELRSLQELLAEAQALPKSITPPAATWRGIQQRIEGSPRAVVVSLSSRRSRMRIPLLAAAAIALMVLSSAVTSLWIKRGSEGQGFAASQAEYARVTAELAQKIEQNPAGLTPRTLAILERNLAIVDGAIREAEEALKTDPGDTNLEEMLLARYQQRLELLQRAARAGQES